jgi:ParB-like chromosome segregation protein Spo0J
MKPHPETVKLADCKPFPLRDFTIDPIQEEHVRVLRESIREYGFWGGVALRRNSKGELEVIDGAHRVVAALAEGIAEAKLYVGTLSDEEAIRLYATHNTLGHKEAD